jgi:hypothetical protein
MHQLRAVDLDFLATAPETHVFEAPVAAPAPVVFDAISADPSTWSWFPGLARGAYESPPPHGVGSIRAVRMGGTTYRETIVGWERDDLGGPSVWAYRVDEASVPLASALLEEWAILPDAEAALVRWTFAIDPRPLWLAGRVAAPLVMGSLFRRAMGNLSAQLLGAVAEGADDGA